MRRFKFAMKQVQIGWATRDVSTDKPIVINGQAHLRVSRGVIDPVTTTALVLDDGEDCVIFVSLDMVSARSCSTNCAKKCAPFARRSPRKRSSPM